MYQLEDETRLGEVPGRASAPAPARPAKLRDGVAANGRLTGAVAVALLVLLAAEGVTIPFIGQLLGPHMFIGILLIGPIALKLASTGYRFARYYTGSAPYVKKGPPPLALRLLAPGVVLTTVVLFGTGVALLFAGPPSNTLKFAHKAAFIAWFGLMAIHVLGHLLELPALAMPDWRRAGPAEARLAGAGARGLALAGSIVAGLVLALLIMPSAGEWL